MSDMEKIEKSIRARLTRVSPSFCAAKWLQVTLHLHSGENHSCHHPKAHKTPLSELATSPSALHNTSFKKKQRAKMLRGERPPECEYCWNIENLGPNAVSDRILKSGESWAEPSIEEMGVLPPEADVNPTYVEVSFSNVCNFKCSYCSANFSTSWREDLRKHGPYSTRSGMQTMDSYPEEDNPYIKAFWQWWPDLVKGLRVFRVTGGEPLLSKNTFRVLEELSAHPRPELEFALNSNLGVSPAAFRKFLDHAKDLTENGKIKRLTLFTSVDGWGGRAEYMRNGLNFLTFQKNVETFLGEVPRAKMTFMATFNALSVTSFMDLLRYVLEVKRVHGSRRLNIDTSYLNHPLYQTVQILPPDFVEEVERMHEFMVKNEKKTPHDAGFEFHEIVKMKRIAEWMRQPLPEAELLRRRGDFYRFFSEHDQRRETDFVKTFPELTGFWRTCAQET